MDKIIYQNEKDDEQEIDVAEILMYLLHWIWLIAIAGIITAAIGFSISAFIITPQYKSSTKIYILSKNSSNDTLTYSDTQLSTLLTKDFEALITSRYVLETVINDLQLPENYNQLVGKVSVSNTKETRIISISVEDANPERARIIADAIRDVAAIQIQSVMDIEAVNVVDVANLPTTPSKPSKKKFTLIGFAIGVVLMAGILTLRFYFDDSIKTSEDVEKYLGMTTLAMIPLMQDDEDTSKKSKKARRK